MMIFKRLLRPKWQDPNPDKRIAAIAELSESQSDYKQILHELAFNDGQMAVRQAALEKLNDFSLWWQASKKEASERLRAEAERRVVEMVTANQLTLSLKQQFIAECQRSSVLEHILRLEQDRSIRLALLQRLDRQDLYQQAVQDPSWELKTRLELLPRIEDEKTLQALQKQLEPALATAIDQLLTERREQQEKPIRLRKQASLILSKINALKDRSPADSQQRYDHYQQEWAALADALNELDEAAALFAKHQQLSQSVEHFFADSWQQQAQQRLAEEQQQQQQLQINGIRKAITALEIDVLQSLRQNLPQANVQQLDQFNGQYQALSAQLEQAEIPAAERVSLQRALEQLGSQLADLPRVALRFSQAEQLLQQWQAEAMPDTLEDWQAASTSWQQYRQRWQQLVDDLSLPLPEDLKQQQQTLQQQWQSIANGFEQQLTQALRQCRGKLHEFARLHQAGKFKSLFGLFKGIEASYQQLLPEQQQQLQSRFEQAREQLAQLADLQAFIAGPRREALVQQMQQLAAEPMFDANERAALVKKARADWLSLGKTDSEQQASWQQAFDEACEAAYAPCREFFAAQQAEREQHASAKQALLTQTTAELAASESDPYALLRQLQRQWQAIGPVPKAQLASLQQGYRELCQQLRQQGRAQQADCAERKQQLIQQAQAATEQQEPGQAAVMLKQYQQAWKQIPYAGKGVDDELWRQFRAICDAFFANQKANRQQQEQQRQQQQQVLQQQLADCDQALAQSDQPQQLSSLQTQLKALDLSGFDSLQRSRQQLLDKLEQKQHQQHQAQALQAYQQLFEALRNGTGFDSLPAVWRDAMQQQPDPLSRSELTLVLELMITGEASDASASAQQISTLKLQLLAEKHNKASSFSKETMLARWLSHGPLAANELPLLERLERVLSL